MTRPQRVTEQSFRLLPLRLKPLALLALFFLGLFVQAMFSGRSGDVFFKFMLSLPFLFVLFVVILMVDSGRAVYRRIRFGEALSLPWARDSLRAFVGRRAQGLAGSDELRTLRQLEMLTSYEFELAVGDLMKEMGFKRVRQLGGSGDLGVDLTARDPSGRTVAVQCKKWDSAGTVGSRDLQLFIGMTTTHHRTDRALFVSTARYTKPASNLARQHGIELWDGAELSRLLTHYRDGESERDVEGAGFAALSKADVKLRRKEERKARKSAEEAVRKARYVYEHNSTAGFYLPDSALDLARESAGERALRRRHPDQEPTEEEIDELIAAGSPTQPTKRCEDCGENVPWSEALPGHYCFACGRAELWIADERKVMSSRSKKLQRFQGAH